MADWLLLYHQRIGCRPLEIAPCRAAIETIQARYPTRVKILLGTEPNDYARGLRDYWHVAGDLLSVEQDMEITEKQIQELLDCPHPACAFAYWIFPASSNKPLPFPTATQEFSGHAAPGFCRLKSPIRQGGNFPIVHWSKVEWEFDHIVRGAVGLWHHHGPAVPHHHGMLASERQTWRVPDGHLFRELGRAV